MTTADELRASRTQLDQAYKKWVSVDPRPESAAARAWLNACAPHVMNKPPLQDPAALLEWIKLSQEVADRLIAHFLNSVDAKNTFAGIYQNAMEYASEFRESNPVLPALPPSTDNPAHGLVSLRQWCVDASRVVKSPSQAQLTAGGNTVERARPVDEVGDKKAKAIALAIEKPEMSDADIAKAVGVSRTTLYDWDKFKALRSAQREVGKNGIARGRKSKDGRIEADDDDADDSDDE